MCVRDTRFDRHKQKRRRPFKEKALPNGFPCLLMITKARAFPSLIPTIIDYKSYLISPSKIEFFFSLEMINHQTNEEGRKRKI